MAGDSSVDGLAVANQDLPNVDDSLMAGVQQGVDHDLGGVSNVDNGPGLVGSMISKKDKSVQKPSVPNKRLQNIKARLEDRIKKMKVSKRKETNTTTCSVCKTPYSKARHTRRFGRWVGCESCNTWTQEMSRLDRKGCRPKSIYMRFLQIKIIL